MQTLNWIKEEEKQILHWQNFQTINITRHFEFWKDYDRKKTQRETLVTALRQAGMSQWIKWLCDE